MSVNAYQNGVSTNLTSQRIWMGTKEAHDAAQQAGTLPNNALIAVTDDFPTDCSDRYSTDETKTYDTWIDGKPIYRKVVNIGSLPNATTKSVASGITNLDNLITIIGYTKSGTTILPLPLVDVNNMNGMITVYYSNGDVIIRTGIDRTSFSGYVILEYTKTTDT